AVEMKNLFLAIVMVALAVGTPCLAWPEYSAAARLRDDGKEGALSALAETSNTLTRGGRRKRAHHASPPRTRVRIMTSEALVSGQNYPVLFSAEGLGRYSSGPTGLFHAYRFGRKSDSTWSIFAREFGTGYLIELAALELVWVVGAGFFFRRAFK